jgi:Ca2+:H+ antiporter
MPSGKHLLNLLLVFVPASIYLGLTHAPAVWVFVCACVAVVPLAATMGEATEHLTHHAGPAVGGLLTASFGNAAELILGLLALRAGEQEVVKASLTGSIIGNLLLVLGLSMVFGGWKHAELRFSERAAQSGSATMLLAVAALVIPAIYAHSGPHRHAADIESISLDISWVLIFTYAASLVFSLKSHRHLFAGDEEGAALEKPWTVRKALLRLIAAAVTVGVVSEFLVDAIDEAAKTLGLGKLFIGVVVVALVGNAAEHATAVMVARKRKMNLVVGIAMGAATQVALFVAPVLVIAGHLMGQRLGLEFTPLEIAAVILSVGVMTVVIHDGRTNWFEGVQLLAVYAILAVAFFFA